MDSLSRQSSIDNSFSSDITPRTSSYDLPKFKPTTQVTVSDKITNTGEQKYASLIEVKESTSSQKLSKPQLKYLITPTETLRCSVVSSSEAKKNQEIRKTLFQRTSEAFWNWWNSSDKKCEEAVTNFLQCPDDVMLKSELINAFRNQAATFSKSPILTSAAIATAPGITGITGGGAAVAVPVIAGVLRATPWASIIHSNDLLLYNEARPFMKHYFVKEAMKNIEYGSVKTGKKESFSDNLVKAALLDIDVAKDHTQDFLVDKQGNVITDKDGKPMLAKEWESQNHYLSAIETEAKQFADMIADFFDDPLIPYSDKQRVYELLTGENKRASWDTDQVMKAVKMAYYKTAVRLYDLALKENCASSKSDFQHCYSRSLPCELNHEKFKEYQAANEKKSQKTTNALFTSNFMEKERTYRQTFSYRLNPLSSALPLDRLPRAKV